MDPETIEAQLSDGSIIHIQATPLGGAERIADLGPISFTEVTDTVKHLSGAMLAILKEIKPRSGSLEFGVQVGVQSGKLTTLIVQGTATANLKITLNWGELEQ